MKHRYWPTVQTARSEARRGRAQVRVEPYAPDGGEDLSAAAERLLSSATGEAVTQIAAGLAASLNLDEPTGAAGVSAEAVQTRDVLVAALTDAVAESLSAEAVGRTSQVTGVGLDGDVLRNLLEH